MSSTIAVPFRLTIGVTGHRNLKRSDALHDAVLRAATDLRERYRSQVDASVELAVLSPLAPGADQLVADAILEDDEKARLKVVLPLTIEEYLESFDSPEARDGFYRLLEKTSSPMTLRQQPLAREYPPELIHEARKNAYLDVGHFVVDHCDALIAVWDGMPTKGRGGTADIVAYARERKCSIYWINSTAPDTFQFEQGEDALSIVFAENVDEFNRKVTALQDLDHYADTVFRDLFENPEVPEGKEIADPIQQSVRDYLLPWYAVSSSIAKRFQKIYQRAGLFGFWMAFLAVGVVATGLIFFNNAWWFYLIEGAILGGIAWLIHSADRQRSHKHWMEYRLLTERLRSATFLSVCGVEPAPVYINRRKDTVSSGEWTALVFEEIWSQLPVRKGCDPVDCGVTGRYVEKCWIDDQIQYHAKKARGNFSTSKEIEWIGEGIFALAIAMALLHVGLHFFHHPEPSSPAGIPFGIKLLTLISILLPALAATLEAIRSHREYKRLANRNRKMLSDLEQLKKSFRLLTPERLENVMKETEQLMQQENMEWFSFVSVSELYKAV